MTITALLCCHESEPPSGYDSVIRQITQDWPQLLQQGEFRNIDVFTEGEADSLSFEYQEPATGFRALITCSIAREPFEQTEELLPQSPLWPAAEPFNHQHAMHVIVTIDDVTHLNTANAADGPTAGNTPRLAVLLSQMLVSIGALFRSAFAMMWFGADHLVPMDLFTTMAKQALPHPMTEVWVLLTGDSDGKTAIGYTQGMTEFNIPEVEVVHGAPDINAALSVLQEATTVLLFAGGVNIPTSHTADGVAVETPEFRYGFEYCPTVFGDSQMVLRLTEISPV